MRKYKEISKMQVFDGDVIKYIDSVYDDTIFSKNWNVHFIKCVRFLRVKSITNNLNARCIRSDGSMMLVNMVDDRVISAYTAI